MKFEMILAEYAYDKKISVRDIPEQTVEELKKFWNWIKDNGLLIDSMY